MIMGMMVDGNHSFSSDFPAGIPNDTYEFATSTELQGNQFPGTASLSLSSLQAALDPGLSKDQDENYAPKYIEQEDHAPVLTTLESVAVNETRLASSMTDIITTLKALSVEGPLMMTNSLYDVLGCGSQFIVYRNHLVLPPNDHSIHPIQLVAIKRALFKPEYDQRLDLTSKGAKKSLHHFHLEIRALCDPALRDHRNVVKLLGWAEDGTWHHMPLLILEIAKGDLANFLKRHVDWSVRHLMCLDMGAGLDALHKRGIIHGDFKPPNVLIFENNNPIVPVIAKLADFGFSVGEAETEGNGLITVQALTDGWEAPEIAKMKSMNESMKTKAQDRQLSAAGYFRADLYSFGLVVWSMMCLNGDIPPRGRHNAFNQANIAISSMTDISAHLRLVTSTALKALLQDINDKRPDFVGSMFLDGSVTCQAW